jgi:uncharacterized protein YjcR
MPGRLTGEQRDQAVYRYEAGESAPGIAESYGVSHVAILKLLKRRGVRRRPQVVDTEGRKRIASEIVAGVPVPEVARKYGRKPRTIVGWVLSYLPTELSVELEREYQPRNSGKFRYD